MAIFYGNDPNWHAQKLVDGALTDPWLGGSDKSFFRSKWYEALQQSSEWTGSSMDKGGFKLYTIMKLDTDNPELTTVDKLALGEYFFDTLTHACYKAGWGKPDPATLKVAAQRIALAAYNFKMPAAVAKFKTNIDIPGVSAILALSGAEKTPTNSDDNEFASAVKLLSTNTSAIYSTATSLASQATAAEIACENKLSELLDTLVTVDTNSALAQTALNNIAGSGDVSALGKATTLHSSSITMLSGIAKDRADVAGFAKTAKMTLNYITKTMSGVTSTSSNSAVVEAATISYYGLKKIKSCLDNEKKLSDAAAIKIVNYIKVLGQIFDLEQEKCPDICQKKLGTIKGGTTTDQAKADIAAKQTELANIMLDLANKTIIPGLLVDDIEYLKSNNYIRTDKPKNLDRPYPDGSKEAEEHKLLWNSFNFYKDLNAGKYNTAETITPDDVTRLAILSGGKYTEDQINKTIKSTSRPVPVSIKFDVSLLKNLLTTNPGSRTDQTQAEIDKKKLEEANAALQAQIEETNKKNTEANKALQDQLDKILKDQADKAAKDQADKDAKDKADQLAKDQGDKDTKDKDNKILGMDPVVAIGAGAAALLLLVLVAKK